MDPALHTAVVKALEKVLERALQYDPGSRAALRRLSGRSLAIRITQSELQLYVIFVDGQCQLSVYRDDPVDCTLSGSVPAVVGLLWREHHSLAGSGVGVQGDVSLLQAVQKVLAALDLDWEQALSDLISPATGSANAGLLTHPLAQMVRAQGQWLKRQSETAPDWLRDYLTEELRLLPSPYEIQAFCGDVDDLRADTERLEVRLAKLRHAVECKTDR